MQSIQLAFKILSFLNGCELYDTQSLPSYALLFTVDYGNWEMQHLHEDGIFGGCERGAGAHRDLPQEDIPWTLASVSVF